MRLHIVRGFLMGSTIAVAVGGHGCSSPCNDTATCAPPGATTSSSMTSSGPGGGGGGMPVGCDPAANMSPVADSCGVFVSSSKGDDGGDGTKAKPYKTITKALGAKKNVYLCGEKFSEAVALTAGTNIFGALKCSSDWSYDASTKSGISGPAGAIPLKISGMGTSTVQDVAVTAADAMMPGDSSIAALVDGSTVTFARVGLTAGKAADGAVGDTPMGTGQDGTKGPDGKKGCIDTMTVFPDPATATNDCGGGESSTGGLGGAGNAGTNGQAGGDGGATPVINNPNGGAGQLAAGGDCKKGDVGKDGAPGTPGDGAKGPGSLSAAGYAGVSGGEGKSAGKPGQGGGGGGTSGIQACGNKTYAGPSGAGGGSGGCGGKAGKGGTAGGSSIALVSLKAKVTLADSKFTSADGGAGGKGSDGQPGGVGKGSGLPGNGDNNTSCQGGKAGNGGQGGAGGGGLGGYSIGIAYTGTAPTADSMTMITVGKPGAGGDGGMGNQGSKGADGAAAKTQSFDKMT